MVEGAGAGEAWVGWIDAGEVVTSGGLSSGIAMALHLVDRFAGRDLALRTARQIEYDWDPEAGREHEHAVKFGTDCARLRNDPYPRL